MNFSPNTSSTDSMIIGMIFLSTSTAGNPAISPPRILPTGMVMSPIRRPLEKNVWSSFSINPSPTGMEKTRVHPSMEATMLPESRPACSLFASSTASEYPPISLARIEANMAGSAPNASNAGMITGPNTLDITGARQTIPTMPSASGPIALKPSSNFSPRPRWSPVILSTAPINKPIAITHIIISLNDITRLLVLYF